MGEDKGAKIIMEVYSHDGSTGAFTRIGEIGSYYDLEFNKKANRPAYAKFSMNVYDKATSLIKPFENWILIKRDGLPEFFGSIRFVSGSLSGATGALNIECADVLYSLNNLYVEGSYVRQNTDAGTIASELVALAQAKTGGNYGIQNNNIETVGDTNETLFYQSIGRALTNQSDNIIGYDLLFDTILDSDGKVDHIGFSVVKSAGTVRDNLPPLETGQAVNQLNFGISGEVYNKMYTLGAGTGDVDVASSTNATSVTIFGLREQVKKEPSVYSLATLQTKGDKRLNVSQGVRLEIAFELTTDVKPKYGEFGLHDTLKIDVKIGETFFNFKGTAQIREIIFSYQNDRNQETIYPIVDYYKT